MLNVKENAIADNVENGTGRIPDISKPTTSSINWKETKSHLSRL
jgi:hypothetical protein